MKKVNKNKWGSLFVGAKKCYCPYMTDSDGVPNQCGDECAAYDEETDGIGEGETFTVAICWGRNIGELIDKPEKTLDNP